MPKIKLANIIDNPYRDRTLFPTSPAKIASLKESIDQTGFWDNIMCRVQDNYLADGTKLENHEHLDQLIADGLDFAGEVLELSYGHHRLDALLDMGVEEVDIPVKFITKEDMLRIMSNENREGWGSGVHSKLETVRQVHGELTKQIASFTDFNHYTNDLGDKAVLSRSQFLDAKGKGVGYRTVQAFLGADWPLADVRIPMSVFKATSAGLFDQNEILDIPSMGVLDALTACIVAMYDGGKIRTNIQIPKLDEEDKVVMGKDGKPIMVDDVKYKRVGAPNWPVSLKKDMVKRLIKLCLPVKFESAERSAEGDMGFVKESTMTQADLNGRRLSMLENQSSPTTKGKAVFDFGREIRRKFFPSFENAPKDQTKRDIMFDELNGELMKTFLADPDILGWSGLAKMQESLGASFETLKADTPEAIEKKEAATKLQAEMDQKQSTSTNFESGFKDLKDKITLTKTEEGGEVKPLPAGQISVDFMELYSSSEQYLDELVKRSSEVAFADDAPLKTMVGHAIAKLSKLYATVSDSSPEALVELQTAINAAIVKG